MKARKHVPNLNSKECVFFEILTIKKPKNGKKATLAKNHWRITVEIFSEMKLYNFYDTKNGIIEPTCERFKNGNKMSTR